MKAIEIIGLGAVALIGYNILSKKIAAGTLNFFPGQFKSLGFNGASPFATVGIVVQNTSNHTYIINSIAGNVFTQSNGKVFNIGNVSAFQQQSILPNSQSTIFINLQLSLIGVVSDLINTISQGAGIKQDVRLQGFVNVSGLQIPVDFNYTLG